jgi:hypothetical protein
MPRASSSAFHIGRDVSSPHCERRDGPVSTSRAGQKARVRTRAQLAISGPKRTRGSLAGRRILPKGDAVAVRIKNRCFAHTARQNLDFSGAIPSPAGRAIQASRSSTTSVSSAWPARLRSGTKYISPASASCYTALLAVGNSSGDRCGKRSDQESVSSKSTVGMPAKRCVIATMAPVGAHQQYPGRPAPPCGYHFLMAISE